MILTPDMVLDDECQYDISFVHHTGIEVLCFTSNELDVIAAHEDENGKLVAINPEEEFDDEDWYRYANEYAKDDRFKHLF